MFARLVLPTCLALSAGALFFGSPVFAQESAAHHAPSAAAAIQLPEFDAYEVEYTSAFGRFTHQVRPVGDSVISILNIIETPQGVIVDHRGLDAATMRQTYFYSPYFAWGQEYVVGHMSEAGYDWTRVPLGGGAPQRISGEWETGGVFDSLGFSPTLAALMPMESGESFSLTFGVPIADGQVRADPAVFVVVGREALQFPGGIACECWILEQQDPGGSVTRFWVDRHAPFIFRRHRDIGGPRDFVSDIIRFRAL